MAGSVLTSSDKLMTAASTGNTELVIQLLANNPSLTLEPDEVTVGTDVFICLLLKFT